MSVKQDPDIKTLSKAELRRLVMRLRRVIKKLANKTNDGLCHLNDHELHTLIPGYSSCLQCKNPRKMNSKRMLRGCKDYIARQVREGHILP